MRIAKIYKGYFGSIFYVPPEMDILITFTPKKAYDNSISPVGKFRFKATYMPDANPNPLDSSIKIV